jgi:hypothetical protein
MSIPIWGVDETLYPSPPEYAFFSSDDLWDARDSQYSPTTMRWATEPSPEERIRLREHYTSVVAAQEDGCELKDTNIRNENIESLIEADLEKRQTSDSALANEEILDSSSRSAKSTGRGITYPDSVVTGVSFNYSALFPWNWVAK